MSPRSQLATRHRWPVLLAALAHTWRKPSATPSGRVAPMTSRVVPAAIAVEPFVMELIALGPLGLGLLGYGLNAMVIASACRGYRVG